MPSTKSRDTRHSSFLGIAIALIVIGIMIGIAWVLVRTIPDEPVKSIIPSNDPTSTTPPPLSIPPNTPSIVNIPNIRNKIPTVHEQFQDFFPDNEANFITKPYQSSVSQCHLTTNGVECKPLLRNVRWKEPLNEVHIYDIDSPVTRPMNLDPGPPSPCLYSLEQS